MSLWYYEQSGVIPYRILKGKIEVLLVTSRNKKKWIIPKGLVEEGLTSQESAAKEALEEAGVEGFVHFERIGKYKYEKWGGLCVVDVYLLGVEKIHETWLEHYARKRKWFPISDAVEKVERKKLKKIIKSIPEYLLESQ